VIILFVSLNQKYFEETIIMKTRLWPGVVLGSFLLLATTIFADPIKETSEPAISNSTAAPSITLEASKPNGPYAVRNENSSNDLRARWSISDDRNKTAILAFTSTHSANTAASLMQNNGGTLSFAKFGRVPFYQFVTVSNDRAASSKPATSPKTATTLPEPTTLFLLGSGLAALAAGLRKRNTKSER
jgi:hypothetical protein